MGKVLGHSLKSCRLVPVPDSVPEYKVSTLYPCPSTVPNYWYGHLQNVVFTLVPVRHRARVQCPGTKCEQRLNFSGGMCKILSLFFPFTLSLSPALLFSTLSSRIKIINLPFTPFPKFLRTAEKKGIVK